MTSDALQAITGKYVFLPNPCTTEPCLPGMAYAVRSATQCVFLTTAGRWLDTAIAWQEWTPQVGDAVTAVGQVRQGTDVRGLPFLTMEVESLTPAAHQKIDENR